MMQYVTVSADTHRLLMKGARVEENFKPARQNADGTFTFKLKDNVIEKLLNINTDVESAIRIIMVAYGIEGAKPN